MERKRSETLKLFVVQMLVGQLILAQIALVRNGVNQACGFLLCASNKFRFRVGTLPVAQICLLKTSPKPLAQLK